MTSSIPQPMGRIIQTLNGATNGHVFTEKAFQQPSQYNRPGAHTLNRRGSERQPWDRRLWRSDLPG